MRVAEFLAYKLGGDVVFDKEESGDGHKHADNIWRNKIWEIKTPSNSERISDRLEAGLGKIYRIKGHKLDGVIINIENIKAISKKDALTSIYDRLNRSAIKEMDVMVKYGDELLEVFKIKHKKIG